MFCRCTPNKLPNKTHLHNFISSDDVIHVFEAQLKKIKRDKLVNDQVSMDLLQNYISDVVLLMINHYTTIGVTHAQYEAVNTNERTGWRRSILTDLNNLDRTTVDVQVLCEGGTTFAKQIDIRGYMNW